MARILAQHGIEQFVYFWLSKFRNAADIRRERRYMEKAVKQLQFFLNPPCCDDPEATVEFRRLDNDLTRFIAAQIAQGAFDRRKWKKSLERAILAINNKLENPCCIDNITFRLHSESFNQLICDGSDVKIGCGFVPGPNLTIYIQGAGITGPDVNDYVNLSTPVFYDNVGCGAPISALIPALNAYLTANGRNSWLPLTVGPNNDTIVTSKAPDDLDDAIVYVWLYAAYGDDNYHPPLPVDEDTGYIPMEC